MIEFNTLEQLVEGIKALKAVNLNINYDAVYESRYYYHEDCPSPRHRSHHIFEALINEPYNSNVQYVLDDIGGTSRELIDYLLRSDIDKLDVVVINIILDSFFKFPRNSFNDLIMFQKESMVDLYIKTQNKNLEIKRYF